MAERRSVVGDVRERVFAFLGRLADAEQAGGELQHVLRVVHRGHEAGLAAAEVHVDAQGLHVAADDVRAEAPRGGDDAEADRVTADDDLRACCVRHVGDLLRVDLEHAEIFGVFEVDRADFIVQLGLQIGKVHTAGGRVRLDDDKIQIGFAVVADDGLLLGVHALGQQRHALIRDAAGHADGGGSRLRVVHGRDVDHFHVDHLGHEALEFEQGLEASEVVVGLAAVSGQEFALARDLIAEGGHVMLVAARSEEVQRVRAALVLLQQAFHVASQLVFRAERFGDVHVFLENDLLRNFFMELLDGLQADLLQHLLLDLGDRVGDVGMALKSFYTHYL